MTFVSDATIWSVTYDRNCRTLAKAEANNIFIVQASLMIITYDSQNSFTVQATGEIKGQKISRTSDSIFIA
jgi:hypothetical protein